MDKCLHLLEFSDRKYRDLPQCPLAYLHETIATAADQVPGLTYATSSWGLFNLSQRKREKWHGLPGLLVQNSASLCRTARSFLTKPLLSQGKVGQKVWRKEDFFPDLSKIKVRQPHRTLMWPAHPPPSSPLFWAKRWWNLTTCICNLSQCPTSPFQLKQDWNRFQS